MLLLSSTVKKSQTDPKKKPIPNPMRKKHNNFIKFPWSPKNPHNHLNPQTTNTPKLKIKMKPKCMKIQKSNDSSPTSTEKIPKFSKITYEYIR